MTLRTLAACFALSLFFSANAAAQTLTLIDHCNLSIRYLFVQQHLRFTPSSAALTGASQAVIDSVAEIAADCPSAILRIEGHTDNRGDEALNVVLSKTRAQSVADALHRRGIAKSRLQVIGLGSSEPIADNTNRDGRAMNRRIHLSFLAADDDSTP